MKKSISPCVLTIAGTDPSGGAGIQADIKTISANKCYAASVITALVAQNTTGVQAIQEVPVAFIEEQLHSVFDDIKISTIKIGMLHNKATIKTVATFLRNEPQTMTVLDPVMIAKNGCPLLDEGVIQYLKNDLFPLVKLITPNLHEAEKLTGQKIRTHNDMEFAAKHLGKHFEVNVLIKGGHLDHSQCSDVLYLFETKNFHWFHANRIMTNNTHGTGCTLSSAIASFLARNFTLHKAVQAAKIYLTCAIQASNKLAVGQGCGPVNHFYFL